MNMNFVIAFIFVAVTVCLVACSDSVNSDNSIQPPQSMTKYLRLKELTQPAPIAVRNKHEQSYHGITLSDPYFWLKDQQYPTVNDADILTYLEAENAYHAKFLEPHKTLVDTVFDEFKGRTDETEESVPYIENGYQYHWFYREGEEYRTRSRKNLTTGDETVFLDENALAQGHEYYVLGDWDISPDNRYLAYSFDTAGDERYQVNVIDLVTGEQQKDVLEDVEGGISFSSDSESLVYALLEKERWHAKHLMVHRLGTEQSEDRVLYVEEDDGFSIGFQMTSSKQFLIVSASQGETQESYALNADLSGDLMPIVNRDARNQQTIDHAHGYFYMLVNDTHKNSRLVRASDKTPTVENWQTIQAGSDNFYLLDLQNFDEFMVLKSRNNGLEQIEVLAYPEESETVELEDSVLRHSVQFPEDVFSASIGINPEFKQTVLRLNYESMVTPDTIFDYQVNEKQLLTRKVKKVPSGYDKSQYETERVMITARDGAQVPVSIVYKKGFKQDGSQPMWLYGYGAYSATITPSFSTLRLSALDRGFSYAIAHVRGGAMMGYQWYLDGKLDKRTNTFNDFVDVAQGLVELKYVSAGNISVSGRSAGGELMGAVTVQAPELWRSVNLGVPFVDVLNTMLDATLPLTPPEWEEWGNPIQSKDDFQLLQSYSPYDNIEQREYPPMYVSGGLNDPRVTYWEPAKWTAKMRAEKTDDNLLVMRINMGAGHFANSGRYGRLRDYAEEYVFMFTAHGITE